MRRRLVHAILSVFLVLPGASGPSGLAAQAVDVPDPEAYFGFRMGADRQLARWDRMLEYYDLLDEASDRLIVENMGETTLGNTFPVMYFTSAENHARLDEIKRLNALLSDPRGASETEIEQAIEDGRAVIVQSFCLHSTEVAGGQTAVELAYDMVTRTDEEMTRIMEETVGIMFPCMNPDGEILVTDWYDETVGTEYEGVGPPSLYHHYIGHDNNRDAFMQNTVESRYVADIMFREWIPQAYVDHHQMGAYTARIYLPPYAEPVRPEADPLVWREMSWYGAHQAYKMEEEGLEGAVNAAIYSGWGHFGFHWITPFHNIAGMLTESASARLATPLYVHPEQLRGSRQLPEYEEQTTFPNPWEGGWWTVRDIVDRQKVAYIATLDIAARNRETVLRNAYLKAKRQTERGTEGSPAAFIVPNAQHDRLTMLHMVNKLLLQGIDVRRAHEPFVHEGRLYPAGTFVVPMAQPKRGVIRWLLGRTFYPDNSYTRDRGLDPIRPYDMATDNMAEFMGVRVDATDVPVGLEFERVEAAIEPEGRVAAGSHGYAIDARVNAGFRAVNLLWNADVPVRRTSVPTSIDGGSRQPGVWLVGPDAPAEVIAEVARTTGVSFHPVESDLTAESHPVRRQRVAMYQRYLGGNMDEGWTRWLLEDFEFPYTSLFDERILEGDLIDDFDVIILPADNVARMTGESDGGGGFQAAAGAWPPEYRSGFGQAGVDAIEAFVEAGGTLVTFAEAGDFAMEELDLPLRNAVAGLPGREFWSPGSTLRVRVDSDNRFAWGMPERALVAFLARNQVYEVVPGDRNHTVTRVVEFVDRDLLESGWLIGEDHIADKATMVTVDVGEGTVVLIGFRAQHRAQTHGTFKLVFNALVSGPDNDPVAAGGGF